MNDNNLNNNLNFIDSIPAKDIHSIGDKLNICNIKIIQHEKNYIRNLPIDIISFIFARDPDAPPAQPGLGYFSMLFAWKSINQFKVCYVYYGSY